jgi:short subunit dehydrogenase-like uncharacterized protein
MEHQYGAAALASGSLVASAAGFDSVPAEMGTLFTIQHFLPPPVVCTSVSMTLQVSAPKGYSGHFATW